MHIFFLKKRGFTLIELIISITIFSILTTIMIVGFQDTREIKKLKGASLELLDDIRIAQNNTMAGRTTNGVFPIGGYGIHMDINDSTEKGQYIIFADQQSSINSICQNVPNERYDNDDDYTAVCANDLEVKKIVLPDKIEIDKIRTDGIDQNYIDIAFMPPKPVIYTGWLPAENARDPTKVGYNSVLNIRSEIILKHIQKGICRKVTVISASSQMDEEQIDCP